MRGSVTAEVDVPEERVVVRAATERKGEVDELFRPLVEAGNAKMSDATDEKLEFMARFLEATAEMFEQHAARLALGRQGEVEDATRLSAPLVERAGVRKSRVGGWRILYTVDRDTKFLYVATIDTRGQVYKHS